MLLLLPVAFYTPGCNATIYWCWSACYADGLTYNFPREVMFFSFNVSWRNTTNSSTLEPSKLIRLPFIPCLQRLSNVYITCTTYTQVPVTDSKTWLLLKRSAADKPSGWRCLLPRDLHWQNEPLAFSHFPLIAKKTTIEARTGKEISTRRLRKSTWCLLYSSQFWCHVALEWLNEKLYSKHIL